MIYPIFLLGPLISNLELRCLYSMQPFTYPWVHVHVIKLFAELKVQLLIFRICEKRHHPKVQVQNIHRNSHGPFTSVLWSVLHWNDPELAMKSKHGQQYQLATVWTRGDRAAKPSSQLGAQINRQDRHSVCVYSSLWLCLCGTKALFEQVRIVDDCMRSIINEDILRGPGSSIMMYTSSHQPCLSHPCLCIFKSTYSIIPNSPFSSKKNPHPTTSEKNAFNIWNADAAVSVGESSGFTRSSTSGCDPVPCISSVSLYHFPCRG